MIKEINNTKIINILTKGVKTYSNPDITICDYLCDIFYEHNEKIYEDAMLALYKMGRNNINKVLRQACIAAIPNDFANTFYSIDQSAKDIIAEREDAKRKQEEIAREDAEYAAQEAAEEAEYKAMIALEETEETDKKAKQVVRKKLVASLSKEQKKLWKELNLVTIY
jgi:ribosomal protein S11